MKRRRLPCDGSDNALRAVGHVAAMADNTRSPPEITLRHVLAPLSFTSPSETLLPGTLERARPANPGRLLDPAERMLQDAGVAQAQCLADVPLTRIE